MKRILCALLFVFGLLTSAWADSSRYASESVLNSGKWVKIQVAEDGIYKLTAADLKKMGFSNLDKVAVYGYGGWPLDEDFSTTYIDDVPEVVAINEAIELTKKYSDDKSVSFVNGALDKAFKNIK